MSTIRDQLRQILITEVAPSFRSDTPLEQLRQFLDGMGAAAELPANLTVECRPLAGLNTEWLSGSGASTDHALLHFHGGGYVMGSCASHRALTGRAGMACGVQAVLPEYRLAPEHPYPAAVEDAVAAYRELLEHFDANKVVMLGDSAGGGLVLSTLLALRDAGAPMPAAAVLISPYTDLSGSGESIQTRAEADPWLQPSMLEPFANMYRGGLDVRDPRISPLFADLSGLPPMLIHVGDHEILLSDSTRLAERAGAAGVEVELEVWPELWHVWHLFAPMLPEANEAFEKIGAYVRGQLGLAL